MANTPTAAYSVRIRVRLDNVPGSLGRLAVAIGEVGGNIAGIGGFEINTIAMPEHCEWQSIVALHLGWPLGTDSTHVSQVRQFLRDPQDALHRGLDDGLDERASLPADAQATGYQVGQVSVLLAVSDQSAIYLSDGDRTERWPEVNPVVACD